MAANAIQTPAIFHTWLLSEKKTKQWKSDILFRIPGFKIGPYKVIMCFDGCACYLLRFSSQLDKSDFSKCLGWISFSGRFSRGVLKNKDYYRIAIKIKYIPGCVWCVFPSKTSYTHTTGLYLSIYCTVFLRYIIFTRCSRSEPLKHTQFTLLAAADVSHGYFIILHGYFTGAPLRVHCSLKTQKWHIYSMWRNILKHHTYCFIVLPSKYSWYKNLSLYDQCQTHQYQSNHQHKPCLNELNPFLAINITVFEIISTDFDIKHKHFTHKLVDN